ncbi:MAG TPA: hypothetical protein VKU42_07015 [Candidatus Angelobacter sp.]|nr:hypothetical protein [Candidatus Angelobacter sp.]
MSSTWLLFDSGKTLRSRINACRNVILALSFLLVFVPAFTAQAQDASSQIVSSQIKAEIERLQQSLKDKPLADPDMPELNSNIANSLQGASAALAAGHIYRSLEQLGQAEDFLQGVRCVSEKGGAIKDSLPAFETEWNKASLQLTALNKSAQERNWSHANAAIRALAEAAQGRTMPLLEGSRGFATATNPKDGLFYMGQAQGEAAFAVFVSKLNAPHKAASIPLRSVLPELEALQEKTNAAFQPPLSIDMHPRFIQLNATLKFARELDSARAYAGALYQYLEAVRNYGMLDPKVPDTAKQASLRSSIADELKKSAASKRDDSIAQIFLEKADGWLTKADGAATSPDEWRAIQVILEHVLPAYYAALKPAGPMPQRAAHTATLTLVRWPYT